ncbi:hypothetical protein ROTAS13_04225 [Roseomonas sp. TAS13]|nr:hypothetical protein ROTAS13_04225 [Roseomonas sp. TAS13]
MASPRFAGSSSQRAAAITAAVQATDSSRRMATNSSEKASIFSG